VLLVPTVYGQVGGDGVQAFAMLRSAVLDQDLALENDYRGFGASLVVTTAGAATSHLPIGLAILWAPAFVLAHAFTTVASALGAGVPADGFSMPYRSAVTFATFVYGAIALGLLEAELRRRHGRAIALVAVLALAFATPLHFYLTANPAMAHGASVFAATAFVVSWLRVRGRDGRRRWIAVGALGAVMTLVRLQDVVLLALPLIDLAVRRPPRWRACAGAFLAVAAALGLLQLAAWVRLFGTGFLGTVLEANLVGGTTPHVAGVLFSPRHGLFYWSPVFLLCVIGWLAWARRDRLLAGLVLLGFAAAVLVNASMQDWWGSEAFGQRRLLGLAPLFGLGLGEALAALAPAARFAATAVLALLALWTWSLEGIYNSEVVARRDEAITYAQAWRAQGESMRRRVVRGHGRLPPGLWRAAWTSAGGAWIDDPPMGGLIDLGAEPAAWPFLVGRGWYDAQAEEGTTVRLSRGPASFLRVPVRDAHDRIAVVRLRPVRDDVPLTLTFEVNREPVGTAEVTPGWREYRFPVAAPLLRPGLNDLGLVYSTTPRQARPDEPGRNAAVAVDWVRVEPARP
jgi:hypothetical protein